MESWRAFSRPSPSKGDAKTYREHDAVGMAESLLNHRLRWKDGKAFKLDIDGEDITNFVS
jgi:hypothetical protein